VDTQRTPKRIVDADLPDKGTKIRLDLRTPSPRARLPTPVAAKAGPVSPYDGLRPDDREDPQNRRKPSIRLDKEPAVVVRQPDTALNLTPQNDQLMSNFSASSRHFDLNGKAKTARTKQNSPNIVY
jgi:hypothetical protein